MPKGPQGQKRPTDVIGAAVMVARIATGEVTETIRPKDPHAVALGKRGGTKGGKVRAERLSSGQRKKIAADAASKRWKSKDKS